MPINKEILDIYFSNGFDLIPIRKKGKNYGKAPLHLNWIKRKYTKEEIIEKSEQVKSLIRVIS